MLTWETGIAFGRALEQLRSHDRRIGDLEEGRKKDQAEFKNLKALVMRAGLLLLLGGGALGTNVSAEDIGKIAAAIIKGLPK